MRTPRGFTLIELLVVVAIIVVLLALLAPGLEKAIYQAELTACGAGLKGGATGLLNYAAGNQRKYPNRNTLGQPAAIFQPGYDTRPQVRDYFSVNGVYNDPLAPRADYDNALPDSNGYCPRAVWFGWRYDGHKGMFKLGDRWTWRDPNAEVHSFNILLSDLDFVQQGFQAWGSHPDSKGVLTPELIQDEKMKDEIATMVSFNQFVCSRWVNRNNPFRGDLDMNFAADDGSVVRATEISYSAHLVGYSDEDHVRGVSWNNTGQYGDAARVLAPSAD